MLTGVVGLLGHWKVLLQRISQGEGILGPIRVDHRSKRRSSSDFLDSWVVLSAVLMVLTWNSIRPLDLGKWGDEVM